MVEVEPVAHIGPKIHFCQVKVVIFMDVVAWPLVHHGIVLFEG